MYNELTLIQKGNNYYVDSREVAALIEKEHNHLLRDIRNYVAIIDKSGASKNGHSDFFLESSYLSAQNKEMPCYLISRKGAEVIANKLTGEKGVLFTVAYVEKFHAMEEHLRIKREKELLSIPSLTDCNDTANIVVPQLKRTGATTYRILDFLNGLYEPVGVNILVDGEFDNIPQTYTALQIAFICGAYSMYGNPHAHAVSCILNEYLDIDDANKFAESDYYTSNITSGARYSEYALLSVKDWLADNNYPRHVYSDTRTYHVIYRGNR